uniref:Uncharacterized protein n=1 Tax=Setaria viridis TaxID=4556 RepID=A0A4U6UYT8_SETVI|nr:hypothetical protein SEVIR_4G148501v2 [Setaria viridis]
MWISSAFQRNDSHSRVLCNLDQSTTVVRTSTQY